MHGGEGDDAISSYGGNDIVDGNGGDDVLDGGSGADTLSGGNGADSLTGGIGNDLLTAGAGRDSLFGGTGNDIYVIDSADDVITELAGTDTGTDEVDASCTFNLNANLENLTLTGIGDFDGTGNTANNTLNGNTGNNRLDGGAGRDSLFGGDGNDSLAGGVGDDTLDGGVGNDTLAGGAGNDTYVVDNSGDVINETTTSSTEIDTVQAAVSWTLGNNLENLTLTGSAAQGIGNALANRLNGNSAANLLNGGTGNDTLAGGAGNDTYVVDNSGDVINETTTSSTEIDTVQAAVSWTLGNNLENLTLTGSAAQGIGNALANRLNGNSAANLLNGGTGNDTLAGGAGNDTYVVDNSGDVINETTTSSTEIDTVQAAVSWTLGNNLENLTLTGSAAQGIGNALANRLNGNSAANLLNGGTGNDTLAGGAGNDTYVVDNSGDVINETTTSSTEIDTVQAAVSWTLGNNLENLTLTGSAAQGIGNALANRLNGNSAANLLNGGTGNDTLAGGAGNDTYVVDNSGDVINETTTSSTEIDTVQAAVSWTLGNNLENLTLTGSAAQGIGNALANRLNGNSAANLLNGGIGNDTIDGGAGADTLIGDNGSDSLVGGAGDDTLNGGIGADNMAGGAGNDVYVVDSASDTVVEETGGSTDEIKASCTFNLGVNLENLTLTGTGNFDGTGNVANNTIVGNNCNNRLDGGIGNDTIDGGIGNDVVIGGAGNDVLTGNVGADTITGGVGQDIFVFDILPTGDVITDFTHGLDKIDLSAQDANIITTANDTFTTMLPSSTSFTMAGQLKFVGGVLYGNIDADSAAEFSIQLTGVTILTTGDFVL
ncbi:serralysin [Gammaproteobacteria bacterium]